MFVINGPHSVGVESFHPHLKVRTMKPLKLKATILNFRGTEEVILIQDADGSRSWINSDGEVTNDLWNFIHRPIVDEGNIEKAKWADENEIGRRWQDPCEEGYRQMIEIGTGGREINMYDVLSVEQID